MEHHCCQVGCSARAEWTIVHGNAPCDYTEACTQHVGTLLTDAPTHSIYPLDRDLEWVWRYIGEHCQECSGRPKE